MRRFVFGAIVLAMAPLAAVAAQPELNSGDVKIIIKQLRANAGLDKKEEAKIMARFASMEKGRSVVRVDQRLYSWTDRVYIEINAPDWNSNSGVIDTIGSHPKYPVLIKTRSGQIGPYTLSETGTDSGVFTGYVTLQGFDHEVEDNYAPPFNTESGAGPYNGRLQAMRGGKIDSLTVSFQHRRDTIYTRRAVIDWNVGELSLSDGYYEIGGYMGILLKDPDRNIYPDRLDTVSVRVWSETDLLGTVVKLVEHHEKNGEFWSEVFLSGNRNSSGRRLRVSAGDKLFVEYADNTLPEPYTLGDELKVLSTAKIVR